MLSSKLTADPSTFSWICHHGQMYDILLIPDDISKVFSMWEVSRPSKCSLHSLQLVRLSWLHLAHPWGTNPQSNYLHPQGTIHNQIPHTQSNNPLNPSIIYQSNRKSMVGLITPHCPALNQQVKCQQVPHTIHIQFMRRKDKSWIAKHVQNVPERINNRL